MPEKLYVRLLVLVLLGLSACEGSERAGPATVEDIEVFCAELETIASSATPCNTMALQLARLADREPRVRLTNHDELLRAGMPNAAERRAYEGCKRALAHVQESCGGRNGPTNAVRAIRGERSPRGESVEAWTREGNSTDRGKDLLEQALK